MKRVEGLLQDVPRNILFCWKAMASVFGIACEIHARAVMCCSHERDDAVEDFGRRIRMRRA